jgi:hypothetical protein
MNRDTPERYMSGLAAVNTTHSLLAMERNKMYSRDQILEDGLAENDAIEGLTRRKDKARLKEFNSWQWSKVVQNPVTLDTSRFGDFKPADKHERNELFTTMNRDMVKGGYFVLMTQHDTLFRNFALTSIYTENESWFRYIFNMSCEDQLLFIADCQTIGASIFSLIELSVTATAGGVQRCFHYQLLLYFQTYNFNNLATNITGGGNGGIKILVHVLSIKIKEWLKDAISEMSFNRQKVVVQDKDQERAFISTQDEKREISDFLGWAIFSLHRVVTNERDRSNELKWARKLTHEDEEAILELIDGMRTTHLVAVLDGDYLRDCYADSTLMRNHGGLTLVDKRYFRFGKYLLRTQFENASMWRHGA